MSERLRNPRTILVTGATGGIGRALALEYAGPGRTLILGGRDRERMEEVESLCRSRGAGVIPLRLELRDSGRLQESLIRIDHQNPIDLAIVNAGITSHIGPDGEGESWPRIEAVIDINLKGALATVTPLVERMRARGSGQIALVSSLSAWFGLPLTPAYCASKAGLKAYGEALRGWLAPRGVSVNVILPGFVESAMSRQFPGPRPFLMSPEEAAARIRRGLERDRARIAFPFPLAAGMWALALLPAAAALRILKRLNYTL
ncbi:MAG TPA: SDR family NAD(P)-dependent oxidoreductase [Sedimenticola thiotaurini]|uniref:SDR family NAD(P)-dependent oxidoreductase n=1 Tax=Sedimenticola thiotaurini TaxID=1543721 RepID=A0A831RQ13_9GAMM|nr:SDR family NAD(P)-dependent oxidoreductase [Sedimenticola thiotaurini]